MQFKNSLLLAFHANRLTNERQDPSNNVFRSNTPMGPIRWTKYGQGLANSLLKTDNFIKHLYQWPISVFAIHIINPNGTEEINYIHKDHTSTSLSTGLGSWSTITDEDGSLLQELSFDAWGNRRNPDTWRAFTGTAPNLYLTEVLPGMNILNCSLL